MFVWEWIPREVSVIRPSPQDDPEWSTFIHQCPLVTMKTDLHRPGLWNNPPSIIFLVPQPTHTSDLLALRLPGYFVQLNPCFPDHK